MSCKPQYKGIRYNSLEELYKANGVNEQQKQQAQQKFQEYVNSTGKQDIEGFKDFVQGKQFQKLTAEEKAKTVEQVTKEHRSITALKDLSAKLAHRIGGTIRFENNPNADWKGYNQGIKSVLNEAYMTPDTLFHEILAHPIIRAIKNKHTIKNVETYDGLPFGGPEMSISNELTPLYQSLLKELETGRGKEVFEQVKRDYVYKDFKDFDDIVDISKDFKIVPDAGDTDKGKYYLTNDDGENFGNYNLEEIVNKFPEYFKPTAYTLEEQQEEAIVQLVSLMAADKLNAKKDATLISKLKELWKQISDFVKSLLRQDGIKIDELPITTTLNDLAEIMAYGNNKIILQGYKIEYSTSLGNKYDTLEEVNSEIKEITALFKDLKLEDIDFKVEVDNTKRVAIIIKPNGERIESDKLYEFIQKDKEYAQSEAIINEYKKINNIQYDPEEVYSRGQGFYSSIGAYSNLELDLLLKNLIQHIEDLKKVGGEFRISAFTKPINTRLKHIEGTGDRIRFVIYPQSEHIKWAAPTDVYSGSVWDAHKKVSKDKKSELLGVSFTKAPALRNINEISPNLADIIDNISHAHNELGIELTTNNFRIEYDDNIDYSIKKLIDNINKILDDKYGKLEKPEINTETGNQFYKDSYRESEDVNTIIYTKTKQGYNVKWIEYFGDKEFEKVYNEKNMTFEEAIEFQPNLLFEQKGKQPTQTRENTTSIESVKNKLGINTPNIFRYEDFSIGDVVTIEGIEGEYKIYEYEDSEGEIGVGTTEIFYNVEPVDESTIFDPETNPEGTGRPYFRVPTSKMKKVSSLKEKEYTSQAETNLKVAALKEVARKYPRSLITSRVVPINPNLVDNSERQYSKVDSKQDIENFVNNQPDALISDAQKTEIIELSKDVLITDGDFVYNSTKQLAVTKSIESVVYGDFIKSDKEGTKLFVNKAFSNAKAGLQSRLTMLKDLYSRGETEALQIIQETPVLKFIGTYSNLAYLITEHERILKPAVWNQFQNQVLINLQRLGISVKNNSISDMSIEEIEETNLEESLESEDTIEGNDGRIEKTFNELSTFQNDSKNTAGWRVKMELSRIRSGKVNFLGIAEYLPFDTVFDDLQNILSPADGDINQYINILSEAVKDNKPKWYLNDVIKLLKDPTTPWSTKNNFVSVMQRAHNEFKLLLWKRAEDGWTLNVIDSNRNSVVNKILDTWNENFKTGNLVIKDPVKGMSINKEAIKIIYNKFKAVNIEDTASVENFLKNVLFPELGIVLPESAMKELLSKELEYIGGKFYNIKGNIKQQFRYTSDGTSSDGIISHIIESLRKDVVIPDEDASDSLTFNNPFVGENSERAIKFLAQLSAKHGLKLDTNTFRNVESKMIYAYSFFIPEKLRINELNSNQALRNGLSNNPLTKFSTYLKLLNEGNKIEHNYMDGMVQSGRTASGITRQSMSYREQFLTAIAHFQSDPERPSYVGLTHSDKSVTSVTKFKKHKFSLITSPNFNGVVTVDNLPNATIKEIKNLVLAEVSRIQNFLEKKNTSITPDTHGEQYYKGAEYFYFFPKLNDLVRDDKGKIIPQNLNNIEVLTNKALEEVINTINETVSEFQDKGIAYKFKDKEGKFTDNYTVAFKQSYISNVLGKNNFSKGLTESETKLLLAQAAADMDINYMIHNANMMMLVHGDPALFFKKDVENTLIEYQKRLAKDAAPGALGHNNWKIGNYASRKFYNVVIANDITHGTLTDGYVSSIKAYTGKIDRTDAQEYTTVEEHLYVLASYGKIPDYMFIRMMDKIMKAKQDKTYYYVFDEDELSVIFQPLKPVQIYYDDVANESNVNTMYYIKSSSFPLLPQFTKNLDIDKVRVAMERDDVHRLAFKTAVKTGHKKLATIADNNGVIKDNISFVSNINQLGRKGFSIQQDVPYEKDKHRILTLSQMNKLLFEGLSDLEFEFNKKKISGLQLKKYKEAIRSKLFEISADELYKRLGIKIVDGSPKIEDYSKLVEAIKQEAIERNWGINDIDTLRFENGNFVIPLGFNNSAARIEALVLSMFTNTIIKQKINGKSFVQGSSEGFRNNVKTLDEIASTSGIVLIKNEDESKNFNPSKGLTTSTVLEKGNTVIRAQVFIPWKFAGELKDFIKDGFLDLEKVPAELLHLIGARIPNQGHSSQIALQVVGFIPETMGDLILVPGEITKQMGADFDVDKLYTYIYNNILDENGNLIIVPNLLDSAGNLDKKKYFRFLNKYFSNTLDKKEELQKYINKQLSIGELLKQLASNKEIRGINIEELLVDLDSIKLFGLEQLGLTKEELKEPSRNFLHRASLENEYIKIHNIVLTHPDVVKKSTNPLDKEDLKITGKVGRKVDKGGNFLTVRKQIQDYLSQKAGKDGVGVFSRAVVGATVLQDYDLKLGYTNKEGQQVLTPFNRFGYKRNGETVRYNLVRLSGTASSFFDGNSKEVRSKIDNIITQQSGSVDNAKEQVLADNNLNMTTFNVSIILSMLQEEGTNAKALDITYNTYFLKQEIIYDFVNEITKLSDTLNEDYIGDKIEEVKYLLTKKYLQRAGIPVYEITEKVFSREDLKSLLEEENTSSVEYVKDQLEILDSFILLNSYGQELSEIFTAISVDSKGLGKSYWESNLKEVRLDNLGNKPLILNTAELLIDSEIGKLSQYVREANKVLAELFPYASKHVTDILSVLEGISGKQDNINLEFRQAVWEAVKMYSYRNNSLDVYGNREDLFYGDNSLAKRIQKFKGTDIGKSNLFILKLRTVLATKAGNPDLVTFSASSAERTDESDVIKSFIDLFISNDPEILQLAEDLVKYAFTSGGIQKALEYIKYIPTSYLLTTNFGRLLSTINGSLYSETDYFSNDAFIEQFLRHNPQYARKYSSTATPSKNKMVIPSQEVDNKYTMVIYKDGKQVALPVPYIVHRNVKTNEWWLYKLSEVPKENIDSESTDKYVYTRIGLLGGKGKDLTSYKEYEFNRTPQSLIPSNNVEIPITIKTVEPETPPVPTPSKENNITKPNTQSKELTIKEYFKETVGVDSLVNLRKAFKSERFGKLLDFLISNSDYMSKDFKIVLNNNLKFSVTGNPVRGKYTTLTNTIEINVKKAEEFLKARGLELNNDNLEQVILHEVMHAFTSKLYNDWKLGKELPANVVKSLTQIEVLFNMANRKLSEEGKTNVELLKEAIKEGNLDLLPQDMRNDIISEYYGFTSPKEFIAEIFSNPEFQEILNNIESDKNFLQRFFEIIKNLFQGIKENSLLNESMNEVLSLIDVANKEFGIPTDTQQPTETINIYFGTNENSELSNFAIRPFIADNFNGEVFNTIEGAFQASKFMYTDAYRGEKISEGNYLLNQEAIDIIEKLKSVSGPQARAIGKTIKGLKIKEWDNNSSEIMKDNIYFSFEQNPNALQKLLATGNAILTHTQDKGKWGTEFPRLLMEVRDELRIEQPIQPKESPITQSQEYLEYGTFYKFDLQNGVPIKGYYKQSSFGEWNELSSKKTMEKYNTVTTKAAEKVTPPIQKAPEVSKDNTFTFKSGLTVTTGFKLNSQQEEALYSMEKFIDGTSKFFTLKGYAGTGKTTIMKFLVKYIESKNKYNNVVFSSPTHRANAVLKQSLENATVKTLHSVFGLSPEQDLEEFSISNAKFEKTGETRINKGDTLIIDESSLINDELYKFILDASDKMGIKVLFMGDPAQLKPVKQNHISKVFSGINNSYELTKVERTGDNPLLAEITDIRNSTGKDPFSYKSAENSSGEGVSFVQSISEFFEKAVEFYNSMEFKKNKLLLRIVTGTNAKVSEINNMVRKGLFGEAANNIEYMPGEVIMGYDNYDVDYRTKEAKIINSGDYIVKSSSEIRVGKWADQPVEYYDLVIQNIIDTTKPPVHIRMLSKNTPKQVLEKIGEEYENLRFKAMKLPKGSRQAAAAWAALSNFKIEFGTPQDITYGFYTDNYGNKNPAVKIKKTIDYGYAHTIHKSQGGTYKYIFVDSRDISKFKDAELRKQLKYVAVSRAQTHAYILYSEDLRSTTTTEESFNSQEEFDTPDGVFGSDALISGIDNLGMSVGEFMKTLNAKEREYLRNMINNKEIKFKCK